MSSGEKMIHLQSLLTEEAEALVDATVATVIYTQQLYQDCMNILTIQRGLSMLFWTNYRTSEIQTYHIRKIIHSTPHFFSQLSTTFNNSVLFMIFTPQST